jgi:putative sigma-54 modulation protein
MKLIVTGRKCTLKDSFRDRAEKKLEKIERFFGEEAEAKITVTGEKAQQVVEVTVIHAGIIFRAEERAFEANEALDKCVDVLIRQIRKNKTKVEKKLRAGAFDGEAPAEEPAFQDSDYAVVRQKQVLLKPQTLEEAILQMNLLGHQFYMFQDAATGKVCVIYLRRDGNYGLLEPAGE